MANLLSRTNNHHNRLLAILQLQKKLVIKKDQTILLLKDIYFSDIDKIARIIRSMMTSVDNIERVQCFLEGNFEKFGMVEAVRYI